MTTLNYKNIVENIISHAQDKLSDWELEFISNVYDWHVLKDRPLSEKQQEIVLKINRKYVAER